jgi:hypothetical protein
MLEEYFEITHDYYFLVLYISLYVIILSSPLLTPILPDVTLLNDTTVKIKL